MRRGPSLLAAVALASMLPALQPGSARAQEASPASVAPVAGATGVEGRVARHGKPLAGLRVHAYREAAGGFQGQGYAVSEPTNEKGLFTLPLAPGVYYLVAKGAYVPPPVAPAPAPGSAPETGAAGATGAAPEAGEYFGYYGSNPVSVFPGVMATRNIPAAPQSPVVVTPEPKSDLMMPLTGVVVGPDGPVAGAMIHVYTDASQQFRGPDLFGPLGAVSGGTDAEGKFSTELPAGTYFIVASKRKGGAALGQLQIGDLHGFFNGNPLRIAVGTRTAVVIPVEEKLREPLVPTAVPGALSGIRGTIRDPSGAVPERVFVFVTNDPSFILGSMPTRRSRFLEPDGSYFAEVPEGGTYYVFARSGYGGPPETGDWHGFYGEGNTPRPVVVKTGTITEGVDFVVKKVR